MKPFTRREFVKTSAVVGAGAGLLASGLSACRFDSADVPAAPASGWDMVPDILSRIHSPLFPDRTFVVTDHGAVGDGTTDASQAFADAVAACSDAGGGRVVVPAGDYLTGPIRLRSNIELHVEEGAVIRFKQDPEAYLPAVFTRWEGVELMNYSALIYAHNEENVAVTGAGTLDGQADNEHWWPWKGKEEDGWKDGMPNQFEARDRLFRMAEDGVPVADRQFGSGDNLRPSFIHPVQCQNVLIEGVTILQSPMWVVHPTRCSNVTVRGITVNSHGPNNDGCNPESCRDVLIEDCYFDTGDDCIAIKSGRNADGRRVAEPSANIVIRNCTMRDGHGGVVVGSEISGGVHHVFAEDCHMDSPNLERVLRIKTNSVRGGTIEHIYMRNVEVGEVADAVLRINFLYEEGDAGMFDPVVREIHMENVTSNSSEYGLYLIGYERAPISNVYLTNCHFHNAEDGNVIEYVDGLETENVTVNGAPL